LLKFQCFGSNFHFHSNFYNFFQNFVQKFSPLFQLLHLKILKWRENNQNNHNNVKNKIFIKPPMLAFKQPPNLRSKLCHAKLPMKKQTKRKLLGIKPCNELCNVCPNKPHHIFNLFNLIILSLLVINSFYTSIFLDFLIN
jgi:hypothetical protein